MSNTADSTLAQKFLTLYGARDYDGLRELMHPAVEWTMPGQGKLSGTIRGTDALISRIQKIVKAGVKTTLHGILVGSNGLTLSLHNSARSEDGRLLEEELATVLTIDGGKILRIDTYLSDVSMMERFFIE